MTTEFESDRVVAPILPPLPDRLPVFFARMALVVPGMRAWTDVGRDSNMAIARAALDDPSRRLIGVFNQIDPRVEEPHQLHLHRVGCLARIESVTVDDDDEIEGMTVVGLARIGYGYPVQERPFRAVKTWLYEPPIDLGYVVELADLRERVFELLKYLLNAPRDARSLLEGFTAGMFCDVASALIATDDMILDYDLLNNVLQMHDISKRIDVLRSAVEQKLSALRG